MKKMIVLVLTVAALSGCQTGFHHWGDGDNGWGHRDSIPRRPMKESRINRYSQKYPGVQLFLDEKMSTGALVMDIDTFKNWDRSRSCEILLIESNMPAVYHINAETGEFLPNYPQGYGNTDW